MQKLIYIVFGLLLALIVVGLFLPRTHQVEVSIEIDAHPATVFTLVNDFRRHVDWSHWAETDPDARIEYSGSPRGEGATMSWDGAILGRGSQLITASIPYDNIAIAMNPGEDGAARSWFDFRRGTGTTLLTWGFETDHGLNIVGRYFASILGGVIARDYQESLERLKTLAESLPSADFSTLPVEHINVESMHIAYLPSTAPAQPAAIAEALRLAYFEVLQFIDAHGLSDAGAPLSIARGYQGSDLAFDAAIPIRGLNDQPAVSDSPVKIGKTYAGPVIRITHIGTYRTLAETHRKISAYLAATGMERNGAAWEAYISDPGDTPEKDLRTYLYYPVRVD